MHCKWTHFREVWNSPRTAWKAVLILIQGCLYGRISRNYRYKVIKSLTWDENLKKFAFNSGNFSDIANNLAYIYKLR